MWECAVNERVCVRGRESTKERGNAKKRGKTRVLTHIMHCPFIRV